MFLIVTQATGRMCHQQAGKSFYRLFKIVGIVLAGLEPEEPVMRLIQGSPSRVPIISVKRAL
jgi:hypothetical protein